MLALALAATACTGSSAKGGASVSVFSVKVGQCFNSPKTVHAELSDLTRTPCSLPHDQEAYAIVAYANADGTPVSAYPGSDQLTQFAQGACAERFGRYVGTDYLDSKLFFTYLLPSPRSWEQASDRNVLCFVTTAGGTIKSSVKGTKQ